MSAGDATSAVQAGGRTKVGRVGFAILAWIFLACVLVQVFLAGVAIFAKPGDWNAHTSFVHIFEFVPLLMLIAAFVGGLSSTVRWLSLGLFLLIFAQYATANIGAYAGAVHPVIAMVIFWGAVVAVKRGGLSGARAAAA